MSPTDGESDQPAPIRRARSSAHGSGASAYDGGRRRPGGGQATHRSERGWVPSRIVRPYLVRGEIVRLDESRSWRGFLINQLHWVALAVLLEILIATLGVGALTGLSTMVLAAFFAFLAVRAVQAAYTRFVITDLRMLRVSGVLNRHVEFIPWVKVTDVTRSETLFQWLARTATIRVESANENSGFRVIDDVDDPETFYDMVVQMIALKQGRVANSANSAADD
jgi:uncharacterized membrane protein YdbT with pleckstrin-like domain